MRTSRKLRISSPDLLSRFKAHCEEGWSIQSFRSKMNDNEYGAFMKLCKKDKRFKALRDKYKKKASKLYG
jgi:hypothetical protein